MRGTYRSLDEGWRACWSTMQRGLVPRGAGIKLTLCHSLKRYYSPLPNSTLSRQFAIRCVTTSRNAVGRVTPSSYIEDGGWHIAVASRDTPILDDPHQSIDAGPEKKGGRTPRSFCDTRLSRLTRTSLSQSLILRGSLVRISSLPPLRNSRQDSANFAWNSIRVPYTIRSRFPVDRVDFDHSS